MRNLRVPMLDVNADAGHFNLQPIDAVRHQMTPGARGYAAVMIDVRPRAAVPLLITGSRHATVDPTRDNLIAGIANRIPVRDFSAANARKFKAQNQ